MITNPRRLLMAESTVPVVGWLRRVLPLWYLRQQALAHFRQFNDLWGSWPPQEAEEAVSDGKRTRVVCLDGVEATAGGAFSHTARRS